MFRVLLTAYVSLVVLAGPSACCCTTTRAVAGLFAGRAEAAEPARDRPACCCGHHGSQDDDRPRTAAEEWHGCPASPDGKHECPCRKDKTPAVAEARKQVAEPQQFRSILPVGLDLPAVDASVATSVAEPGPQVRNRASHFGSAREILRALRTYLI